MTNNHKTLNKKKSKVVLIIFGMCLIMLSALFSSATALLFVCMIPTVVAFLINKRQLRIHALTIGAMNFAGAYPFLLTLAQHHYTMDKAISLILDPLTIVIAFSAAGAGYAIDWAISGIASNILYQKSIARRSAIIKEQAELVEQWGENVKGDFELDEHGFPLGL